jgi:hypothetical protein
MAAKLTTVTHKIATQLHLVAESCTICSSRSRRPVRKLLDTPSYHVGWGTSPCDDRQEILRKQISGTQWHATVLRQRNYKQQDLPGHATELRLGWSPPPPHGYFQQGGTPASYARAAWNYPDIVGLAVVFLRTGHPVHLIRLPSYNDLPWTPRYRYIWLTSTFAADKWKNTRRCYQCYQYTR